MIKYKKIKIEWSYPVEFSAILKTEAMNDIGIYYISRKFGEKESILYIGKATYNFSTRLECHNVNKVNKYRGKKFVRLGRIVGSKKLSEKDLKELISDAEKTIIFYLSNYVENGLIDNIDCRKTACFTNILKIKIRL